jgi:hypothetical protein
MTCGGFEMSDNAEYTPEWFRSARRRIYERTEIDEIVDLRKQLAELQSQPRLQRVTPEAMAELRSKRSSVILIRRDGQSFNKSMNAGTAFDPEWIWFLDVSTISEVT